MASTASNIPKTMKGVYIEKTGGTEVLQYRTDIPVPEPNEGEILIKNEYIGINYIDTYFRTGLYPPPKFPYILGRDGSGTIAHAHPSIPSSLNLVPGTRVTYMSPSAYAEYVSVPLTYVIPIPDSIPSNIAAASILQALTALTLIRESHPVKRGDWVLVTAAAGGVGLWLCQLLKSIGAHTIAAASTEEKRQKAKEYGAEHTISYHESDRDAFVKEILQLTNNEGVEAVFDSIGQATFDYVIKTVKRKGSLVSFGNASGAVTGFALSRLSAKNIKLLRPTLFNYIATREETLGYAEELWGFIERDRLKVHIHDTYPLEDVVRATKDIEGRNTTGKLLLKP